MDVSVALLGRRPDASLDEIARAAGISRQTIYAHYSSRDALLQAVSQHVTTAVAQRLADLDLDQRGAVDALRRWTDACWELLNRYPVLLTTAMVEPESADSLRSHEPILGGLTRLLDRGRRSREFDPSMPTTWYLAAIIGLGHTAGQEAAAGRMTPADAGVAFRESVLKLCAAPTRR